MERFKSLSPDEINQAAIIRCILRNLRDWAMGSRLQGIKDDLDRLYRSIVGEPPAKGKKLEQRPPSPESSEQGGRRTSKRNLGT
jgi:hypothetical protein